METPRRQHRVLHFLLKGVRVVGPRVLLWGGAALAIALWFGYVRLPLFLLQPWSATSSEPIEEAAEGPAWPHLRGPAFNATSAESGLADSWPAEGPPVLWVKGIGAGYSGFCAVGNCVWTQRQTSHVQSVLCLDADSGQLIWEHPYGQPYEAASMYPGPRATPTWSDGRIYFASPDGLVGCLRAADGRPLWTVNVIAQFGGRGADFGYASSPTVVDGKVILPVGGPAASVVALDGNDGSTVWAAGDEPASYCSPLPIAFHGQRLVVAFLQNALVLHDSGTGRVLWHRPLSRGYDEHAAMPLYAEPHLMISGPFRSGAELFRIESAPAAPGATTPEPAEPVERGGGVSLTGRPVWHSRELSNDVASSVLVDGHVYGFDLHDIQSKARRPSCGLFRCLDFQTGVLRWSSDRPGQAALIAADGKLILLNDRGEVLLVRATATAYEELARARVFGGEVCWTPPALHRGRLYVRSPTRAACLYLGLPETLEPAQLASATPASQMPEPSRWNPACLVGSERDCPADPPNWDEFLRWYGVCVLVVMGGAAVLALCVAAATGRPARTKPEPPGVAVPARQRGIRVVFWSALVVLGVAATPFGNRWSAEFVFTWPVALFGVQHLAVWGVLWAHRHRADRGARWVSAALAVAFVVACVAYYDLCRRCDLAMMWLFLIGLLPSWPVTIPIASRSAAVAGPFREMLWAAFAFSVYYWMSAACAWWFLGH
jgi:outer membrane protein assembly factor BamB